LVYDLTVKSHACYQANGLLVSNSDAARYLALGVREATPTDDAIVTRQFPAARDLIERINAGAGTGWMAI
jgi:hypothetical protein